MSDFRYRLRETVHQLAIGEGDLKNRLMLAVTNHLIFANVPEDENTPIHFRKKHQEIIEALSKKQWNANIDGDRIRATIHRSRFKTVAAVAEKIWELHTEYEQYLVSGTILESNS